MLSVYIHPICTLVFSDSGHAADKSPMRSPLRSRNTMVAPVPSPSPRTPRRTCKDEALTKILYCFEKLSTSPTPSPSSATRRPIVRRHTEKGASYHFLRTGLGTVDTHVMISIPFMSAGPHRFKPTLALQCKLASCEKNECHSFVRMGWVVVLYTIDATNVFMAVSTMACCTNAGSLCAGIPAWLKNALTPLEWWTVVIYDTASTNIIQTDGIYGVYLLNRAVSIPIALCQLLPTVVGLE